MAGYVAGSKEWYRHTKERILFLGDLMMTSLTTKEEKQRAHIEQTRLLMDFFNHYEREHIEKTEMIFVFKE